jgi:acyl-[acyl-carrier-protein]-phospholipid O-acyltransferase/long-chain-fatty-acid--[acyl-carrier-protein] ligase
MFESKVADSSGAEITGSGLLLRTLIVRRLLRRKVLRDGEKMVGVLLPPSVGGVVVNAALTLDKRVAVNLNYTLSPAMMNHCIRQAGIRCVLTSRRVLERFPQYRSIEAELVVMEDFQRDVTRVDKIIAAAATWLVPSRVLERWLGLHQIAPDDMLTLIFTSGSTGDPKGVMLSHNNISSNIESFAATLDLRHGDVMLGILPFFHSFGYTTTLWTGLTLDLKIVYHYSPLEAGPIGQLCRQHHVNVTVAVPTFLRTYLRRCAPEDFADLEFVITGSEKLPPRLADEFEAKFGVRPREGYGTTELSPVVSTNVPPGRGLLDDHKGCREGTVGQPLPGVSAKIVDLETGADLGPGKSGMLLISGPNVMLGYLDRPDLTAKVLRDGWYVTGDIAVLDAQGFIHITGRESRFSKLGGEMVPHLCIEEAINRVLWNDDDDQLRVVVTAVPDPRKGERIVVLHTGLSMSPDQIRRHLIDEGLPPLWIPSADSFYQVDAIPVLGTGKLDLKGMKDLAKEVTGVMVSG